MGESPVIPVSEDGDRKETDPVLKNILSTHDVYACQDCGKCSSACPLTLSGKLFSPRALAGAVISGRFDEPEVKKDVWSCLTCGLCYDRCPSGVNFSEFVRDLRVFLQERNVDPHFIPRGVLSVSYEDHVFRESEDIPLGMAPIGYPGRSRKQDLVFWRMRPLFRSLF